MTTSLLSLPLFNWVRRNGNVFTGTISDIVSAIDADPVVSLRSQRADFSAAGLELLIGIFNVALLPENFDEWEARWINPPSQEELEAALAQISPAFMLDGDGPRFYQDVTVDDFADEEPLSIESMLLNAPGSKQKEALKRTHVTDLFVKQGTVTRMSRATAAIALATMQTYATEGGRGHRTSMRGGGPLTTLADPGRTPGDAGRTLWSKLWANVQTAEDLRKHRVESLSSDLSMIFPWMTTTRTSGPGELQTTPSDAHPLQAFFGMPRRIRLEFDGPGICDISGDHDEITVTSYRTRPYGVNYVQWQHPMSPYYEDKGELRPVHGQPSGLAWRDWVGIAHSGVEGTRSRPALVVTEFGRRLEQMGMEYQPFDVHAFGYDTKQNKTRGWVESVMPSVAIADRDRRRFVFSTAQDLTAAAEQATFVLSRAIKSASFGSADDQKKVDTSYAVAELWSRTEERFYEIIGIASGTSELHVVNQNTMEQKKLFLPELKRHVLEVFDICCPASSGELEDMRRRIGARHNLVLTLSGYGGIGESIFKSLEIPIPEKPKKTKRTKRSAKEGQA